MTRAVSRTVLRRLWPACLRRHSRSLVMVLALTLAAGPAWAAGPASSSPFGINGTPHGLAGVYNYAHEIGFGWVRVFFVWNRLQPAPTAPPDFDSPLLTAPCNEWPAESARSIIEAASALGLSVLVNLSSPPCWATAEGGSGSCHNKAPLQEPWQAFIRSVVETFGDRIAAYEIWNEPNFNVNWTAAPALWRDAVLVPGFEAVKSADPGARVVAPALMTGGFYKPEKSGRFEDWLVANGMLAVPIDAVSFHAYANSPGVVQAQVKAPNRFAAKHGVPEVWMTEFGFSAPGAGASSACPHCGPTLADCTSDIGKVFGLVPSTPPSRLARVFYYTLSDRTKLFCLKSCAPGLLDAEGQPRLPLTSLGGGSLSHR